MGVDFAGTVEAVGTNVDWLEPGEEVFGGRSGAFAEYVNVEQAVVRKPASLGFEEAAAVPIAGITALQGLASVGAGGVGQRRLGRGGTFAVQVARALGAEVTGVCSTRNVDLVRELGAARVVDYTREDFTRGGERYDLILDAVGNRTWSDCKRVLADGATVVVVGGPKSNRLLGPMGHLELLSERNAHRRRAR